MAASRKQILAIFNSLPEVELQSRGDRDQHLGASVRNKRFAWYLDDHHGDGSAAATCKAPAGVNETMVEGDPARYFIPSYTGPRGWIGIRLDTDNVDCDRVELGLVEAYRMTAPKSLARQLGRS